MELEVGGDTFRIDMLFYHLKLRCYVVIELKVGKFEPGCVSQLNLYRSVMDDVLHHEDDGKTIGLLLVCEKNDTVVRYTLEGFENPIGVAGWQRELAESLPAGLEDSLPTIEEIEARSMPRSRRAKRSSVAQLEFKYFAGQQRQIVNRRFGLAKNGYSAGDHRRAQETCRGAGSQARAGVHQRLSTTFLPPAGARCSYHPPSG